MFKLDVPHPVHGRKFKTKEDAARVGRLFGVDVRQIIPVPTEEETECSATDSV